MECTMEHPWFKAGDGRTRVLLDGQEISEVFYASEEQGIVRRYKLNAEGKKYIDPENTMQGASEVLCGLVQIKRSLFPSRRWKKSRPGGWKLR